MNKRRKGISLIVLVITILVMLILSGVVIVSLSKNNPVEKAKEATFKENMKSYMSELSLAIANSVFEDNKDALNIVIGELKNDKYKIKEFVKSINNKDAERIGVAEGQLCYMPTRFTKQECAWLKEIGAIPQYSANEFIIENTDYSKIKRFGIEGLLEVKDELYNYSGAIVEKRLDINGNEIRKGKDVGEITNYMPVVPGEKYMYTYKMKDNDMDMYSAFYDSNKTLIPGSVFLTESMLEKEVVAPPNAAFFRVSYPGQVDYISVKAVNKSTKNLLEHGMQIEDLNKFKLSTVNKNLIDIKPVIQDLKRKYPDKYEIKEMQNGFSARCIGNIQQQYGLAMGDTNDLRLIDGKMYKFTYNYTDRIERYRETINVNMHNHLNSIIKVSLNIDENKKQLTEIVKPYPGVNDVRFRWFLTIKGDTAGTYGEYKNFMLYEVTEDTKDLEVPYVEHKQSEININLNLRGLPSGAKDIIYITPGNSNAEVERKIDKITLTGNENFTIEETNNKYTIYTTKDYDSRLAKYDVENVDVISNRFIAKKFSELKSLSDNGISILDNGKGKIKICVDNTLCANINEFKNYIKTHTVDVYFEKNKYTKENISLNGSVDFYPEYTRIYHTGLPTNILIEED